MLSRGGIGGGRDGLRVWRRGFGTIRGEACLRLELVGWTDGCLVGRGRGFGRGEVGDTYWRIA